MERPALSRKPRQRLAYRNSPLLAESGRSELTMEDGELHAPKDVVTFFDTPLKSRGYTDGPNYFLHGRSWQEAAVRRQQ